MFLWHVYLFLNKTTFLYVNAFEYKLELHLGLIWLLYIYLQPWLYHGHITHHKYIFIKSSFIYVYFFLYHIFCQSQVRTWISNVISVQWVAVIVRFVDIGRICWPSLFKMFFFNEYIIKEKTRTIFKKRCTTKHRYYILLRTVFHWNNLNILVL